MMKKTKSVEEYDVIIPSTSKKTTKTTTKRPVKDDVEELEVGKVSTKRKTTTTRVTVTTKKKPTIIIDDNKVAPKTRKVTTTKTKKETPIVSEEEVEYSRVKTRGAQRKKDKRLESLIEEINKDHHLPDIEVLDLPSRTKKYYEDDAEDFLINTQKVEEEEEELLLNAKKEEKTIVIPKVTKETKKIIIDESKKVVSSKPTPVVTSPVVTKPVTKKVIKKKTVKKYRVKKKALILLFLILLLIIGGSIFTVHKIKENKRREEERIKTEEHIKDINSHYNKQVKVNKDALIYTKVGNNYQVSGTIYKDNIINIEDQKINKDTEYFYNKELDSYIKYTDVDPNSDEIKKDDRYKRYIPFNENIVTNDDYIIYHKDESKMYKLSTSSEYPIIIKEKDRYYFEYQDELVYVLKTDVKELVKKENTKSKNVESVPVLNYHFIYDPKERKCDQSICLTASRFEEHLQYFKKNNILDLTMREFELYMDKKLNLPKSVLITIDDGWLRQKGVEILDKNETHGTYFLITSVYLPIESKYVEFHSHTHNMHTQGQCSTGQGGGIQCLSEKKIQEDLAKSRELLNNTTYFCYPFYEWNEYAISQLKKAGFTLGFIGGQRAAKPSDNHYRVPRYIIYSWTTVSTLKQYFN